MRTILNLIAVAVVFFGASVGYADSHRESGDVEKYWVVGSFGQLGSAVSESRRIEEVTGQSTRVARFEMPGGILYRIVIREGDNPAQQKQDLMGVGVEPWIVPVSGEDLTFVDPRKEGTDLEFSLVVGAFSTRERAEAFIAHLSEQGAGSASVIASDSGGVYRVALGPYRYRDSDAEMRAMDLGVEGAWWVVHEVAVAPPEPEPEPEMEEAPAPAVVEAESEPEPEPVLAPGADESYIEYCTRTATPRERKRYCQDGRFAEAAIAEQRIKEGAGGQVLADFCARLATPVQRDKYCTNATFAESFSPPE